MEITVTHEADRSRFVARAGDETLGLAVYDQEGATLAITHTEVEPRFGGRGIGTAMVREVLDQVRAQGGQVLPFCSFVQAFIAGHPDYVDLVPADRRRQFALDSPAG